MANSYIGTTPAYRESSPPGQSAEQASFSGYRDQGRATPEETAVQRAIEASLQDCNTNFLPPVSIAGQTESSNNLKTLGRPSSSGRDARSERLKNVDAFLNAQYERLQTQLPPISDAFGDTYIYIDPPTQQAGEHPAIYQMICDHYSKPFTIKSEVLKSLDSSFFDNVLGPTAQHRVLRRRRLVNKLQSEIKYVVDLTPPNEGEDAVYLLTELSCPEGLLKWSQATQRWNIAAGLIGGEDDFSPALLDAIQRGSTFGDFSPPDLDTSDDGASPIAKLKEKPVPLEYSPVRHRSAIERVLIAVTGGDPKIDSAPKLWTTFAIAKYLNIKDHKLVDYIIRWLRAPPNTYFIEVFPEICLKIADGLQNADLCRDTFALLVGEWALSTTCQGCSIPGFDGTHNVHGRKTGDVDFDNYKQRLEYASKAFRERIIHEYEEFAGAHMKWLETTEEFGKLMQYASEGSPGFADDLVGLMDMLRAYVRGSVKFVLCSNFDQMAGPVADHAGGEELFPTTMFRDTWRHLLPRQRILTRSFWVAVSMMQHRSTSSNPDTILYFTADWNRALFNTTADNIEKIPMDVLKDKISTCCKKYAQEFFMPNSHIRKSAEARAEKYPKLTSSDTKGKGKDTIVFPQDRSLLYPDPATGPVTSFGKQTPKASDDYQSMFRKRKAGYFLWSELNELSDEDYAWHCKVGSRFEDTNDVIREMIELPPRPWGDRDPIKAADQYYRHPILTPEKPTSSSFGCGPHKLPVPPNETDFFYPRPQQNLSNPYALPSDASKIDLRDPDLNRRFRFFNIDAFLTDVESYIRSLTQKMLASPGRLGDKQEDRLDLALTNTLVCLTDGEWKFLPLWADGNDDGSGGVYSDDVPLADTGFYSAGPKVRLGSGSFASSSSTSARSTSEDFDMLDSAASTSHHTSTFVNDGTSTQMDRRRVYTPAEGSEYSYDSVRSATRPLNSLALAELGNATPSSVAGDSEATADTWEQIDPTRLRLNSHAPSVASTEHDTQVAIQTPASASVTSFVTPDGTEDDIMSEPDDGGDFDSVFDGEDEVEDDHDDMFREDESFRGFD